MSELTQNLNFLQPTNFKVVIDRKRYGNLEFFAQRVSHPGVTVNSPSVPYRGISNVSLPGDTIAFSELSFNVIVDEDLKSYIEVFNWLKDLVEVPYQRNMKDVGEKQEVDITLSVQNSHNNTTKKIRYIDCIPTNLGALDMESVAGDDRVVTYPVTFTIGYFEIG
jgi:hypothetical protein